MDYPCQHDIPEDLPAGEVYLTLVERADSLVETEGYEQAERYYRRAIELDPARPEAYVGLGLMCLQADRLDQADAAFGSALRDRPDYADAYVGLAAVKNRLNNYPAAFEMYLKALELDTDNLLALLGLFQASCRMGTFSKITDYLELYLQTHPDDTSVLFCLASLYTKEGKRDEARQALLNLLRMEPDKPEAFHLLSQVIAPTPPSPTDRYRSTA